MINITDSEFSQFSEYIKQHFGIVLGNEKRSLVIARLFKIIDDMNFESFSQYFNYIISDKTGNADVELVNLITTNHTFFMREAAHFDYFQNTILPYLAQNVTDKDLRIWSAGCSSGKEVYTLAMIIDQYFGLNKKMWDCKLLATDISEKALHIAKEAMYSDEEIAPLPQIWRLKYFEPINNYYRIISEIRNEVIFRKLNLMDEVFRFKKKVHVIFCRNVMIYFDEKTRMALVNKFYDLTEDNGYLFISHSESINRDKTKYKYVKPGIYRKERSK